MTYWRHHATQRIRTKEMLMAERLKRIEKERRLLEEKRQHDRETGLDREPWRGRLNKHAPYLRGKPDLKLTRRK